LNVSRTHHPDGYHGPERVFVQDTTFAVFGLGNKQYEHFNAIGKKAFSALQALGAQPLLHRGDGDDDGCIDDDFEKWTGEFAEALKGRTGIHWGTGGDNCCVCHTPIDGWNGMPIDAAHLQACLPCGHASSMHARHGHRHMRLCVRTLAHAHRHGHVCMHACNGSVMRGAAACRPCGSHAACQQRPAH